MVFEDILLDQELQTLMCIGGYTKNVNRYSVPDMAE